METNRRSRCMDLVDSILYQYFRTSSYFPNPAEHVAFVQRVSQQPCSGLAWDKSSLPVHRLHQSGSNSSHGSQSTLIHTGYETSVEVSTNIAWRRRPSSDIGGHAHWVVICSVSSDWLDGSDWFTVITYSGISTSDKAQSFISTPSAELGTSTHNRHQYMLMRKAYGHYIDKTTKMMIVKVSKVAKIRNRYNQVPHLKLL